ncbi:MAG: hypothetical protein ACT4PZ_10405 [Panacagrimonas sp.]
MEKILFKLALAVIGKGMEQACRHSENFRRQLSRDLTIQIGSADGVAHHYVFTARSVTSRRGAATTPTVDMRFASARQGTLALASPQAVGKIVRALLEGGAELRGNATVLLWFYGLTRFVLPYSRVGPLAKPLTDGYVAHNPKGLVASRITLEPAVTELDANWHGAHQRRATMAMMRSSAGGESVPMW